MELLIITSYLKYICHIRYIKTSIIYNKTRSENPVLPVYFSLESTTFQYFHQEEVTYGLHKSIQQYWSEDINWVLMPPPILPITGIRR